ncbi:MAG: HEAT repeat domain-containing protein, partial [Gemmatimonadaceae bacterium]
MRARDKRARWLRGSVVLAAGLAMTTALHAPPRVAAARVMIDGETATSFTQVSRDDWRAAPADSADVAAFLAAVRGAHPLMCDLAAWVVDGNFGWGHWGGGNGPGLIGDEQARALARWALGRKHNESDIPVLRAALSDPDACVRRMAAPLLGRIDSPRAVE